jgi:hypothetical protein
MTDIIIWVNCPKIGCYRGICYCYDCDFFGGLNKAMDKVVCEWKEKQIIKEKQV